MNNEYIKIKQASQILGVSALTLRNWDKSGKLKALRHPMNNYRVYRIEDIQKVLQDIATGVGAKKLAKNEARRIIIQHLTD